MPWSVCSWAFVGTLALYYVIEYRFQIEHVIFVLTLSSGYYMYLETSGSVTAASAARLLSPQFKAPSTPTSCHVNFFYHMYGSTLGTFTVYKVIGSSRTQVFTQSGSAVSQNLWKSYNFYANTSSVFQVGSSGPLANCVK